MKNLLLKYPLLPLLLLGIFYTVRAIHFPLHDFANYYYGGALLEGGRFNPSVYFPADFNRAIIKLGGRGIFASYAPNTPFLALLFMPLSLLPAMVAKFIFNLGSLLLLLRSLQRLTTFYKIEPVYLLLIPVFFFLPIRNELLFGQVYLLVFSLISESWLAYKKGKHFETGIYLALAIMLKVFPVLLLLIFIFRKKFDILAYALAACMVLFGISLFYCGFEVWSFYFMKVLPKASAGEISEAYVANYQSLHMFLKELLVADPKWNPSVVYDSPVTFAALLVGFKFLLVSMGGYVSLKIKEPLFTLSYWILVIVLITPYGSSYTSILLLFPYFALAKKKLENAQKIVGLVLLFAVCCLPTSALLQWYFPFNYLKLYATLAFFLFVFSMVYKKVDFKIVGLIAFVPVLLVIAWNHKEPSGGLAVLDRKSPTLIYDFKIDQGKLTYFYRDASGAKAKSIPVACPTALVCTLSKGQTFYNGLQLTFDKGNKSKAAICGKTLYFLSDYDRGHGFFTLRKIELP
jgi:Glycosyltransferase family 87